MFASGFYLAVNATALYTIHWLDLISSTVQLCGIQIITKT